MGNDLLHIMFSLYIPDCSILCTLKFSRGSGQTGHGICRPPHCYRQRGLSGTSSHEGGGGEESQYDTEGGTGVALQVP